MAKSKEVNVKIRNGMKTVLTVVAFIFAFLLLLRFEVVGRAVAKILNVDYETEFVPALGNATIVATGVTFALLAAVVASALPPLAIAFAVISAAFLLWAAVRIWNSDDGRQRIEGLNNDL